MLLRPRVVILLALVEIAVSLVPNTTKTDEVENDLKGLETRRRMRTKKKEKKPRSTSSDEARFAKSSTGGSNEFSLEISTDDSSTSSSEHRTRPKSSLERRGWRKWHRKCPSCPEDMAKKWRDPSISWICGGYQRARRTFKSKCMMRYRNCQDGTMFVKIHNHRCANDTGIDVPRGIHFFYDYRVVMSDDSDSLSESTNSVSSESL